MSVPNSVEPNAECYPMSVLPHITRLYADYLGMTDVPSVLQTWYGSQPLGAGWMGRDVSISNPGVLADLLRAQSLSFAAGEAALNNIELLRSGARAVVTGQQVGLFGGPLLTIL